MAGRAFYKGSARQGTWGSFFYLAFILGAMCARTAHAADEDHTKTSSIIGIDFGTTNTYVGVYVAPIHLYALSVTKPRSGKHSRVEIIPNEQGDQMTPSWVTVTDDEILIGDAARAQALSNPNQTIYNIKRLIGREFGGEDVQKDIDSFPFEVIDSNAFQPSLVPRLCLRGLLSDANDLQGTPVIRVKVQRQPKIFSPEQISGKQHVRSVKISTDKDQQ
jgi:heat shock protein 5